jgi:hypothetical protein
MTRTKTDSLQSCHDSILDDVRVGRCTIEQAHERLDQLEREAVTQPPFSPAQIEAIKARGRVFDEATEEYERSFMRPPGVPRTIREAAQELAQRPACFESRAGLKDEMVDELNAIQLRTILAAGMVC